MPVSGTIRKFTIGGVTYDVPGDINLTINLSMFETEGVPSTGKTMMKKTIRVPTIESAVVLGGPDNAFALKAVAEKVDDSTMSIELADATVLRGVGQINYENWETEENRHTFTLIPNRSKNAWTKFNP